MPAKLGPDGKPIIVDSVPFKEEWDENDSTAPFDPHAQRRSSSFNEDDPTAPVSRGDNAKTVLDGDLGIETVKVDIGDARPRGLSSVSSEDDDITQVFRRKPKSDGEATPVQSSGDAMVDPLVGWLVVVEGPGKGNHVTLGYGQNTVARSGGRVNLDYGDKEMSRESHIVIVFDPKSRSFFISPGTGKALGYLNDAPILAPSALNQGDKIVLGATQLRFVAFCGPDFGWE